MRATVTHLRVCRSTKQDQSYLTVGCLDSGLKFFSSSGTPKFKERTLEGDPLSLAHFNNEYLLAAGSDR